MLFKTKPDKFNPKFHVVSCFVEANNKILLLLRQDHKSEGNTWGIPTGKIEQREGPIEAIVRELKEETGLMAQPKEIVFLKDLFMRFPEYDFKASVFNLVLKNKVQIAINPSEHKDFLWSDLKNVFDLHLIYDLDNWIRYFYKK